MPLSKARMRERKRQDRVKPMSNLNNVDITRNVKPKLLIPGLKMEGNKIIGVKPKPKGCQPPLEIPLYNPSIHRPGDRVMIRPPYSKKYIAITVPELDGDGNSMPVY